VGRVPGPPVIGALNLQAFKGGTGRGDPASATVSDDHQVVADCRRAVARKKRSVNSARRDRDRSERRNVSSAYVCLRPSAGHGDERPVSAAITMNARRWPSTFTPSRSIAAPSSRRVRIPRPARGRSNEGTRDLPAIKSQFRGGADHRIEARRCQPHDRSDVARQDEMPRGRNMCSAPPGRWPTPPPTHARPGCACRPTTEPARTLAGPRWPADDLFRRFEPGGADALVAQP
jgi:hypothetical protein